MTAPAMTGSMALRRLALLVVVMVIAVMWLVVLPYWANQPGMAAALRT